MNAGQHAIVLTIVGIGRIVAANDQYADVPVTAPPHSAPAATPAESGARIRPLLVQYLSAQLKLDMQSAESSATREDSQKRRDIARDAYYARIERIDEIVADFEAAESNADASPSNREFVRVLAKDGVKAALTYADSIKQNALAAILKAKNADPSSSHKILEPLLSAAILRTAVGEAVQARRDYKELLAIDPQWPAAMHAYAWFLAGPRIWSEAEYEAVEDTGPDEPSDNERGHALATRLESINPQNLSVKRLLIEANYWLGRRLADRSERGSDYRARPYFSRSLEIAEAILAASPKSETAIRDVARCSRQNGLFYHRSSFPNAGEKALAHYTRSLELLELLHRANPDSLRVSRELALALDDRADFERDVNLIGGGTKALPFYLRSLEVMEAVLKSNRDSTEFLQDVASRLSLIGRFLAKNPRDEASNRGLEFCNRSVELLTRVLELNPGSRKATRDLAVALISLSDLARVRGETSKATEHNRKAYGVLQPFYERGDSFDPAIDKLYDYLKEKVGK